MSRRVAAASCLLALALAACGGGGGSSPVTSGSNLGTERFVVSIPHSSTSSRGRAPRYVSPATQSVTVTAPNAPPVTVALTPSNPNCTQSASALICTVDFQVVVGTATVLVSTFASTDGSGVPLSTARLPITVVSGQISTLVVTLNPVVAGLALGFAAGLPLVAAGTPSTATLLLTLSDPAGNTIIGPGTYVDAAGNPVSIAITDSDTTGATSVSPKTLSSTADGNTIAMTYNGAAIGNFTVTASLSSSFSATQTFTVKPAGPAGQIVYVGSYGCGPSNTRPQSLLNEYLAPASGSTTLGTFLGLINTSGLAVAIGANRRGDVFMDFITSVNRYPNTLGTPPAAASVTLPANERSSAMAADSTGGFWVSILDAGQNASFLHYAANADGTAIPDRAVTGIAGLPSGYRLTDTGLALDSRDNVFVAAVSSSPGATPRVYELPPAASGNAVTPLGTIPFGATDDAPRLAVDQHTDTLWEYPVDVFNGSVKISSAGMSAVPNTRFPVGRTLYPQGTSDTYRPFSLAIDDAGNVYAAAFGGQGSPCNSPQGFYVWGPSAGGAVALTTIQVGSSFAIAIPPLTTP